MLGALEGDRLGDLEGMSVIGDLLGAFVGSDVSGDWLGTLLGLSEGERLGLDVGCNKRHIICVRCLLVMKV